MQAASEINKSCPIMVDNVTRLDHAVALPDDVFQYNYTIITNARVDTSMIKKNLIPVIINNIKTNPNMKWMRDNKITMVYYYKDKSGNYLMRIPVTSSEYEEKR